MLNFIGTGSAFNTSLGNNGAFIKHNTTLFLIDCGSNTFDRLIQNNVLDGITDISVILTHAHPDHIGSLGDLIFYSYYVMGEVMKPILTLYAPEDIQANRILNYMGVNSETYTYERIRELDEVIINGQDDFSIQVQPFRVRHVKDMFCFGYVLTYNKEIAYYSGDTYEIGEYYLRELHSGKFKYFYQDTCAADYEGNVHLSLRKLHELVKPDVRRFVYCMHLDKGFDVEEAKELGFKVVFSI